MCVRVVTTVSPAERLNQSRCCLGVDSQNYTYGGWFSVTITSQLIMAVAASNVNFVNVYTIAYRVHVGPIHARIPNTFTESESRFV